MRCQQKSWLSCCLLLLGFAFPWFPVGVAQSAQPGEAFDWPIAGGTTTPSIRFRYCPAGTIHAGRPQRGNPTASMTMPPTTIREFYFGETEVTLAQFRAVMGEPGIASLKKEAAKYQTMNPQLFALVQSGQHEPAFFVGLPQAVQFCLHLQTAFDSVRNGQAIPSIEMRRVRLPSHVEWQYAARAIADANQQSRKPHFNRDLKLSDLSVSAQEKCREVWMKLRPTEAFVGSQEQFLILTSESKSTEKAKVKEILSEVFGKLFGGPPRTVTGIGSAPWDCQKVPGDLPNEWNIYDCHDNVTEWVMWASSSTRRDELWQSLVTKAGTSLEGQPSVFLAGGCFPDDYEKLSHFTIWGGPKINEGTGNPQEFEYQSELVGEFNPGFRILMERMIATDWLFALRRGLYDGNQWQASAIPHLDESQRLLRELADAKHPGLQTIEFYRALFSLDVSRKDDVAKLFNQVAQLKAEAPTSTKLNLAALLDDSASSDSKPEPNTTAVNDDQLFWQSLAALHSARAK